MIPVASPLLSFLILLLLLLLFVNVKTTQAALVVTTPLSPSFYLSEGHSLVVAVVRGKPTIAVYHGSLQDLFVIRCADFTCATTESIASVDNSTANIGTGLSMAIRAGDQFPVMAYHDKIGLSLKVMQCLNDACTSHKTNLFSAAAGTSEGQYSSIALQQGTNYPVISHAMLLTAKLGLHTCSAEDCATTLSQNSPVQQSVTWTSIQLRSGNLPTITYKDETTASLKMLYCTTTDCEGTANSIRTLKEDAGEHHALVLDSQDRPVISYFDRVLGLAGLIRCSDPMCTTQSDTIVDNAAGTTGQWTAVALKMDGNPIIGYKRVAAAELWIASCLDPTCATKTLYKAANGGNSASLAILLGSNQFVAVGGQSANLRVVTDSYVIACPSNSVFSNTYDSATGYAICLCASGYLSSVDRTQQQILPYLGETCSEYTCPTNSILSYANTDGSPICTCIANYRDATTGLQTVAEDGTCTINCPPNSVFTNAYDSTTGFPICSCDLGYVSTSGGDRLAIPGSGETCITVTCPLNSVFDNAYDNGEIGSPICQCNSGYTGLTGVVVSAGPTYVYESGSCQNMCTSTNSEAVTVDGSPACQCIQGYVDSLTFKRPVDPTGTCSEYTCPTNSILSYADTDGSPICTCIANYVDTTTGLQTVAEDGTCTLNCPLHSQKVDGEEKCMCDKGYTGDSNPSVPREVTPGTGLCTLKCGYKGADCTTTNDCCKPDTKFVCRQNQCAVCRKLGTICTRNEHCCSGRCNRKASVCRDRLV